MKDDLTYIERLATSLQQQGLAADAVLASSDPGAEISAPVLLVRGLPSSGPAQ